MSKSVKLKNDVYLDTSSIVHNKKNMSEMMEDVNNVLVKIKTLKSFTDINELQDYVLTLQPNWTTYIFHVSLSGSGVTAIVSKTSDLYSAMLVFGYGQMTLYSLINGVWSSRSL